MRSRPSTIRARRDPTPLREPFVRPSSINPTPRLRSGLYRLTFVLPLYYFIPPTPFSASETLFLRSLDYGLLPGTNPEITLVGRRAKAWAGSQISRRVSLLPTAPLEMFYSTVSTLLLPPPRSLLLAAPRTSSRGAKAASESSGSQQLSAPKVGPASSDSRARKYLAATSLMLGRRLAARGRGGADVGVVSDWQRLRNLSR